MVEGFTRPQPDQQGGSLQPVTKCVSSSGINASLRDESEVPDPSHLCGTLRQRGNAREEGDDMQTLNYALAQVVQQERAQEVEGAARIPAAAHRSRNQRGGE